MFVTAWTDLGEDGCQIKGPLWPKTQVNALT